MSSPSPRLEKQVFGALPDGREAHLFTLRNASGTTAKVCDFGALLVSLVTPDRHGVPGEVTLGFEGLAGWVENPACFGATIGRFGNRIAAGRFTLDGTTHQLATNNEPGGIPCHLHGGLSGFHKALWQAEPFEREQACGVHFRYLSPDGEEGYPGNLSVRVSYTLNDAGELIWEAEATTDAATVVNLVHHSYWNLAADPARPILDHELEVFADHYLPTDAGLIPIGIEARVEGTPLDFRRPRRVGDRVEESFEALDLAGGYDHAWVLSGEKEAGLQRAARLRDPFSGRVLTVLTDQPALQVYSGNFLDGSIVGREGIGYPKRSGICLETEGYPDAPNQPGFPSAVLRRGETYRHCLIHRFSLD